jgi:L-arabinokinase
MTDAASRGSQVLFYVSGHGLGHASRDAEVIHQMARLEPSVTVAVRSSAARWIFNGTSRQLPIVITPVEVDTGVAQIDSIRLDEDETVRVARDFYRDFDRRADAEAAVIKASGATAVVGDIPPLAFEAAARAGVPSIALGNFTWDWIYEEYSSFTTAAFEALEIIRRAYAKTTLALRLPLHGGFDPMRMVIRDIPLIARRANRPREETRRMLGLGSDTIVALASFGGHGVDLPYADIAQASRFTILLTNHEDRELHGPTNLRRVGMDWLADRGIQYADLVAASDVVVSKPGYGIVSECVANGAALLYTDRGRFREHDVFLELMPRLLRCRHISQDDLRAGRWNASIEALLAQDPPPGRIATNGAEVAAGLILEIADC